MLKKVASESRLSPSGFAFVDFADFASVVGVVAAVVVDADVVVVVAEQALTVDEQCSSDH